MHSNTKYFWQPTWKALKPSPQQSTTTPKAGSNNYNTLLLQYIILSQSVCKSSYHTTQQYLSLSLSIVQALRYVHKAKYSQVLINNIYWALILKVSSNCYLLFTGNMFHFIRNHTTCLVQHSASKILQLHL